MKNKTQKIHLPKVQDVRNTIFTVCVIPEARAELSQISVSSLTPEAQESPGLRLRGETAQKRGFIFLSVSGAAGPTKEQDWTGVSRGLSPWSTLDHEKGLKSHVEGHVFSAGQVTPAQQEQAELLQSEQKSFHRLDWRKTR